MTDRLGRSGTELAACCDAGRAGLIGYLPVGYPDVATSLRALRVLAESGCDLVEIGMPYSDPVMDGPTIQHATTTALRAGVRTRDVLAAAEAVTSAGKAPLAMTYWTLIERYGVDAFARDFASAGGVGLITPDLVPEEADDWLAASEAHGLDRVFLIAPSSSDDRIASTMAACRGWVYATALMGVTGVREATPDSAPEIVARAKAIDAGLPVGVGIGVSDAAQARAVAGYADAVIVGSALVRCLIDHEDDEDAALGALQARVRELAAGVGGGRAG